MSITPAVECSTARKLVLALSVSLKIWGPGGLCRECVLRIPKHVVKATKMGHRYIAEVADTALSTNLIENLLQIKL